MQRLQGAGIHSAAVSGARQLTMRRADFEALVASGGLPTLLSTAQSEGALPGDGDGAGAARAATTLSGHYYQQRFGENLASNAGPSLSSLADASMLKARMQAAPITDGTFKTLAEHALSRRVKIVANGKPVQLTGRQIETLSVAAARNPSCPIGFNHNGARVVLTAAQIASLRAAVEEEAPVPPGLLRAPQWFYSVDGTAAMQRGPLGTAELQWKYTNGDLPEYAVAWHPLLTQGWVPLAEIPELQSSSGGGGGGQSSPSAASLAAEEVPELQGRSRLRNMVGRRAHRVERLLPAVKEGETTVLLERTEPGYMRQKETSPLRRLVKSTK